MPRFYLTTAIDYVNSQPHLGHAYEKIAADVIARYKRLCGIDTRLVIGNDEHSQNVYRRAKEQGLDPLAYCDQMEREFRAAWDRLDVAYDDFIRTTQPRHKAAVQELVRRIHANGDVYEGFYEGWYCVGCEAFKQEKDLVDGKCPLHSTVEWIKEKNHFFRLSKYQDALLAHITANPRFIETEARRNEILNVLEGGLDDISISRAGQSWGIPVPHDPSSVVYVWFDALINYASAVGFATDRALFEDWWPADLHIIGKDITRFHAIIWPAMLMSAGLPLPRQIFGHGFLSVNGQRMSKSLGNVIHPNELVERFGVDPVRLYLIKEVTFGGDGDFSWSRLEERYNVDLANNLGNLVSRVSAMAQKYRSGRLVSAGAPGKLASVAELTLSTYKARMDEFQLNAAAAAVFFLIDAANEYIAETEPWALARDPKNDDRLSQVLFDLAEAVRVSAILLLPIMPKSAAEILRRVGETTPVQTIRIDDAVWRDRGERTLIAAPALWPRTESAPGNDKKQRSTRVEDTKPPAAPAQPAAAPPAATAQAAPAAATEPSRITIDDFMKVELRTAKVLAAERVPNSKKLIKLSIDVGTEQRTLVAGIAEAYEPEQLVGRTIVMVFNLKPAKLMGIESNGMVLAASPEGGKPMLVGFAGDVPPGVRVR